MATKGKNNGNKITSATGGASTPNKLIKEGATTPVKPKPKPNNK